MPGYVANVFFLSLVHKYQIGGCMRQCDCYSFVRQDDKSPQLANCVARLLNK